jgi:hypothetical protein
MLGIITAILIVIWLLGFFAFHVTGALIHVALVLGLILLVVQRKLVERPAGARTGKGHDPITDASCSAVSKPLLQKCAKVYRNQETKPLLFFHLVREKNMDNAQWKWEEVYLEAFMETNPSNLSRRVADAENAISLRTIELRTSPDGELEWQAIEDAMNGLSILKREIRAPIRIHAVGRLPLNNS